MSLSDRAGVSAVPAGTLACGLNFERHPPEAVELPQRPVRKGDKVPVLPERGSTAKSGQRLYACMVTLGAKSMSLEC